MSLPVGVPATIDYEGLKTALLTVGIDTTDLMRAVILPGRCELTYARRGLDGKKIPAGDEIATVTVTIGIQGPAKASDG